MGRWIKAHSNREAAECQELEVDKLKHWLAERFCKDSQPSQLQFSVRFLHVVNI